MQVDKLMKNIKIVEEKVRELEDKYILLEKYEEIKIEFEKQKKKPQYQNYKLKLDTLKVLLQGIKKNYDESIKPGLKILWNIKPRKIIRKIKHLSEVINFLSTQCEELELNLKQKIN